MVSRLVLGGKWYDQMRVFMCYIRVVFNWLGLRIMSWIEKVGAPDWAESKPQVAISGELGVKEVEILVPKGRSQVEWIGERESEEENNVLYALCVSLERD